MALTDKQEMFCQEYLVQLNATKSAIQAGYSEQTAHSIGHENLSKPEIKARIKQLQESRMEQLKQGHMTILNEIYNNATSNMGDYIDIEEGGGVIARPLDQLSRAQTAAIRKVKTKRVIRESANGEFTIMDDTTEYELHSKDKALEMAGKYLKLFADEININAPIPVIIMNEKGKVITELGSKET